MNSFQISEALRIIPETDGLLKGCFYNRNIPFQLSKEKECFFIVNTIVNIKNMGHWILFFIKDFHLYYFDSFGFTPEDYGWDITDFFGSYPTCKTIVFVEPIQNEF